MKKISDSSRIKEVCKLLYAQYGLSNLNNKKDPLDEIIYILLTTKTSEANYLKTYDSLKKRFPFWDDIRKSDVNEIEQIIRSGGLSHTKAITIVRIVDFLYRKERSLDLSFLHKFTDKEAFEYLLQIPGVGYKTAKCVLLYSLNRNVLPVDVHTYRLAFEIGLIPATYMRNEKGKLHKLLERQIPSDCRLQFHVGAILHGRKEHTSKSNLGKCKLVQLLAQHNLLKVQENT